jgi:hypothetical protein
VPFDAEDASNIEIANHREIAWNVSIASIEIEFAVDVNIPLKETREDRTVTENGC